MYYDKDHTRGLPLYDGQPCWIIGSRGLKFPAICIRTEDRTVIVENINGKRSSVSVRDTAPREIQHG